MLIDTRLAERLDGFRNVALSARVKTLIRSKLHLYRAEDCTQGELDAAIEDIGQSIAGLATPEVLRAVHAHNPAVFQVIRESRTERHVGISAQLPLTQAGIDALVGGRFNRSAPALAHIAAPGQTVTAFYVWLTYSPQSFVSTLAGLSGYLRRLAPDGATLFCTPLNPDTRALFLTCGYLPATEDFPDAPESLLMARRIGVAPLPQRQAPVIEIEVARNLNDLAKVMAIRAATYMYEQECPFDEEFDGNDFTGTHLLGTIDGEPAGCIRIRYFGGFVKFERLAVRHEFRSSKLAFRLVREAMKLSARKGFHRVYGHARKDIVAFWEAFGFRPIPGRPTFSFSDVEYVEMGGAIPCSKLDVIDDSDPLRIVRPEGAWEAPGVLERPADVSRQGRIRRTMRA